MVLPDRPDQARRRLRCPTILEPIEELLGGSHRETTIDESPPRPPVPVPSDAPPLRAAVLSAFVTSPHGDRLRFR